MSTIVRIRALTGFSVVMGNDVMPRKCYRKRADQLVTAVRLNLDTSGFEYRKWGSLQRCKAGDWIVENGGEVYTVDAESFSRTYVEVGPGRYFKAGRVWAERAKSGGEIRTKEGQTHYSAGDYLVFNDQDGSDGYSMPAERFLTLYEEMDE